MDTKEQETLTDFHDLIMFGKIERELKLFPEGEDGPQLKVMVQSMTTREKKEMFEGLKPLLDSGTFLFNLYLEQHILANVVKAINGRYWRNVDEALAFFDVIQDKLRQFLYQKCYSDIFDEQDDLIRAAYTGEKTVAKLKNLFAGDSLGVSSESPSETTGN